MHRAYSILTVKRVDEDQRVIRGVATTPSPDRMGDIVESLGVTFKNPLPLLWMHKHDKPIGLVKFDKPTKDGINFEATMPIVSEPGALKERLDEAWSSVKAGLVRAVSIGFRAIEFAFMKDGGMHFIKSEVLELSLVVVPAQAEATITSIKSLDREALAASGRKQIAVARLLPPGATGIKPKTKAPQEGQDMPTIAEQLTSYEASRQAKAARMAEMMNKSSDEGVTLDGDQSEEYDGLEADVKALDAHLNRLRALEKSNLAAAKAVNGKTQDEGSDSRGGGPARVQHVRSMVPPGIAFVRLLGAKYLGRIHQKDPADIAKQWPDTPEVEMILRAPVAAGTTTDTTWAAPLVVQQNVAAEFIGLLIPATIIGRIPGLRRVPFNIKVPRTTTGASVSWVGEGRIKPVSAMAFDSMSLLFTKVAGIVPITQELMRFSNPAAEGLIRDSLVTAIAQLTDRDFLDPTKAEAVGVSPASITNGVTPITASGTTAAALRADLGALLDLYFAANMGTSGLVLVMTSRRASRIGMMQNALGQTAFPGLGPNGGTLEQIPVVTSENIVATGGSPADGDLIVAINAPEILLADDGGVEIDVSTEASIQMESAPDSPATASTITVSAFQYNMVFIRAERFITWKKRRDGAVQFIQNAKYAE